jgi:hypothetical protein
MNLGESVLTLNLQYRDRSDRMPTVNSQYPVAALAVL